ncbi:MAG: transcriptional regulator [Candidatus Hodarchaeota archaeon]
MTPVNINNSDPEISQSELLIPSNQIFSSSVRFSVMLILYVYHTAKVKELQKLLQISAGKLDHHIRRLEEAKYIEKRKIFLIARPTIKIIMTKHGKQSFEKYLSTLKGVLDRVDIL